MVIFRMIRTRIREVRLHVVALKSCVKMNADIMHYIKINKLKKKKRCYVVLCRSLQSLEL